MEKLIGGSVITVRLLKVRVYMNVYTLTNKPYLVTTGPSTDLLGTTLALGYARISIN